MDLNHKQCYQAVQARDARFDGRFFTAVKTTGIFCRPICPAPTPKAENCTFYPTAAAAQAAGYRPCLRCHPEMAPALSSSMEASGIASRALRLITQGALDDGSVTALAAQLNVSGRHLRRVCVEHLGASPVRIAQTRRVLFAKQLIDETDLSFTDIAFAAGFSSIRRFNAVVQQVYQRSPRELRRNREALDSRPALAPITLKLPYSGPYNWPQVRGFLAHRAIEGMEWVSESAYIRTISLDGDVGTVDVSYPEHNATIPGAKAPGYLIATIRFPNMAKLGQIVARLRAMFDLDADAQTIEAHLDHDPLLKPTLERVPGIRVPGCWDGFETAVRAVLGQQISTTAAHKLVKALVEAYGGPHRTGPHPVDEDINHPLHAVERVRSCDESVPSPQDSSLREADAGEGQGEGESLSTTQNDILHYVFPTPEALADNNLDALHMPGSRKKTLRALAQACVDDPHLLEIGESLEVSLEKLEAVWGIGPWTAAYIAMRGLHEPDAFPVADAGVKRAVRDLGLPDDAASVLARAEHWRPWRAYATMALWTLLG